MSNQINVFKTDKYFIYCKTVNLLYTEHQKSVFGVKRELKM